MTLRPILLSLCLVIAALWSTAGVALTPALPAGSVRVRAEADTDSSQRLPITAWKSGSAQTIWAEGRVSREVWQVDSARKTTLHLLRPLRRQIREAGYDILYECRDKGCGGFDFRYAIDLLPEPEMHVDLGDYRYLLAQRNAALSPEYIWILVSRAAGRGYIQMTEITAPDTLPEETNSEAPEAQAAVLSTSARSTSGATVDALTQTGRAVLDDLTFATGSSQLTEADFASLAALAEFLTDSSRVKVVLVGHTDAEGALAGNLALSRARAEAVMQRLVRDYGISPDRMQAEGVGFLAPIAKNDTQTGRARNRRVEVVLADPG